MPNHKAPSMAQPGEPIRRDHGKLTFVAQITVDGGFSLNVFTGSERESALGFTVADRRIARSMYKRAADMATAGRNAAEITAALLGEQAAVLAEASYTLTRALGQAGECPPCLEDAV
jgi:hypothetical protein